MHTMPYSKDELGFLFGLKKPLNWDQSTKSLELIYENLYLIDISSAYKNEFAKKTIQKDAPLSFVFDNNEPFAKACLEKVLDDGELEIQFSEEIKDGIFNYYLGTYKVSLDKNGLVIGFYGIISRIGIDQYYERKLRNLSNELNQRIRDLHNINFTTSHRIRSPLARILGLIEIMKLEGKYDPYMEMLEISSRELDKEIRRFTKILEEDKALIRDNESGPLEN